uniref:Reverse transcriptase domain-containing protein n=1 Tax=Tanacetum cinerariifolium TaxID=118510 RepID=A0A6L2MDF4_TANCI|nr:reverse transcriptase domain-containing protein [Tanacetum cinerariifolium]
MESVFHICNCKENCQVKYATCTLLDSALTWWNSHVKIVGIDAAYAMTWKEIIKMMTEVYCSMNEIQKLENELWNLTVKDNDVVGYTQRFQELSLLCLKMVPNKEEKIESLMDQKVRGVARRYVDSKRKWEDEQEGNHRQQQNKRQKAGRVYIARNGNKTNYAELYHFVTSASFITMVHEVHTKRYCPGMENQYGDEEAHQNLDIVTGALLLENYYIRVLTNANTNRSIVFTTNSHLSDVASTFSVT